MNKSCSINYIGVNDHNIDLFEGQYIVPSGMSYNSYIIMDDKVALMDTVESNFKDEWMNNLEDSLKGRNIDYLIIHHMELDHSSNIKLVMDKFQKCKIVASLGAFIMMKNLFGTDFDNRKIVINDGDELCLGKHTLKFFLAPFVHWPEVMMSYEINEKALFSADGFGKFGALDVDEDWTCEARRYYFGIIGRFGKYVQDILKKIKGLKIESIYPLHGPIINTNIDYYLNLYDMWSKYLPEEKGVAICFTSIYGNTKKAIYYLKERLESKNINVSIFDLSRDDIFEAVEDAFKFDRLVLATTTYNGSIFPLMKHFIDQLVERNYQNRVVALIENGMWAPQASRIMKEKLNNLQDITFLNSITINASVTYEIIYQIDNLVEELCR